MPHFSDSSGGIGVPGPAFVYKPHYFPLFLFSFTLLCMCDFPMNHLQSSLKGGGYKSVNDNYLQNSEEKDLRHHTPWTEIPAPQCRSWRPWWRHSVPPPQLSGGNMNLSISGYCNGPSESTMYKAPEVSVPRMPAVPVLCGW